MWSSKLRLSIGGQAPVRIDLHHEDAIDQRYQLSFQLPSDLASNLPVPEFIVGDAVIHAAAIGVGSERRTDAVGELRLL
jgi:hypothetical protein